MENIAILTGGDSAEYNISLLSANTIIKYLNKKKYNATVIHLKDGEYTIKDKKINTSDFSYIKDDKRIKFDKIFIALHGSPAEDGLIQDYLDNMNLPYTSCNAQVSALTFNKFKCNTSLQRLGFRCPKSILIYKEKRIPEKKIIEEVGIPCFVKPNRCGSSYGISKVNKKTDLSKAIRTALYYDKEIIIESFIEGKEVSCGVYFDRKKVKTLPITEIISENDFFDYKAKYEGKSQEITPAEINKQLTSEIKRITTDIYTKMRLSGICRVDFIIQDNKPYILEINTVPGLSEESIIPKQLKAANIKLADFFELCLSNIN